MLPEHLEGLERGRREALTQGGVSGWTEAGAGACRLAQPLAGGELQVSPTPGPYVVREAGPSPASHFWELLFLLSCQSLPGTLPPKPQQVSPRLSPGNLPTEPGRAGKPGLEPSKYNGLKTNNSSKPRAPWVCLGGLRLVEETWPAAVSWQADRSCYLEPSVHGGHPWG